MECQNVIYKKRAGILRLQVDHLTWSLMGSDSPFLTIQYDQIEGPPKINPNTSDAARLKIDLKSAGKASPIFIFADGFGSRDAANAQLGLFLGLQQQQQLKSSASSRTFFDPIYCSMLLAGDPALYELYKKLVDCGEDAVLTEEEFWEQRKDLVQEARFKADQENDSVMATSVLADLRAQGFVTGSAATGAYSSEISLVLTPSLQAAIFRLYPAVERAYRQMVPHVWTEQSFWTKYAKLKKFVHNNSASSNLTDPREEEGLAMLQNCMDEEERAYAAVLEQKREHVNELVDLWATEEEKPEKDITSVGQEANVLSTIRKLNRVSQMMVKSKNIGTMDTTRRSAVESKDNSSSSSGRKRRIDWNEETSLADLKGAEKPNYIPLNSALLLSDSSHALMELDDTVVEESSRLYELTYDFLAILQDSASNNSAGYTLAQLNDLFPAASFSAGGSNSTTKEMESFYREARELLSHFWSSNKSSSNKNERVWKSLCKLDQEKSLTLQPQNLLGSWKDSFEAAVRYRQSSS